MALPVIQFFDESGEIMVCKHPHQAEGTFTLGSQLIVQESQVAVFYRDGQALDGFTPGRHTLSTQNLPFLGRLIGAAFGGESPFKAYIYFVSMKTFINMGWGTASPVLFRDSDFKMISLRAHGSYAIRIEKPRTFLNTLVGTRGLETTFALEEYLRALIVSSLNETLGLKMKSILDLPVLYRVISEEMKQSVAAEFAQYGLKLVDLIIEAITPPPDVQQMINRASGIAVQDAGKYQSIAAADAMRDAAKNTGQGGGSGSSIAADGMGAGIGLAMGMGMAKQMAAGMDVAASHAQPAPGKMGVEAVRSKLAELRSLVNEGLISEEDFEEQKKIVLSKLV